MHGQATGFIDNQQAVVFIENRLFNPLQGRGARDLLLLRRGQLDGGNTDDIAGLQALFRLDSALVHPHLALTENSVDQASGGSLETA